ncbi:hypothetical protein HPP92_029091 [Vanilla planifolia]|uniref:Uncharacterized protein n=1 Tax=Vanilla planifolia TaxID=51239 RepID=A0A835P4Z1_VANPL|nr:hypothetical protein HPP92_029080 [Vanilla planifolia]KAG0445950.1 hypothetical protein HPP92_029091 [Vanilla planifolia]
MGRAKRLCGKEVGRLKWTQQQHDIGTEAVFSFFGLSSSGCFFRGRVNKDSGPAKTIHSSTLLKVGGAMRFDEDVFVGLTEGWLARYVNSEGTHDEWELCQVQKPLDKIPILRNPGDEAPLKRA